MKARPRRKARTSAEPENEIENVDIPVSPSSSKENISPPRAEKESRSSPDVHQQQFIILLIDFDNNGWFHIPWSFTHLFSLITC